MRLVLTFCAVAAVIAFAANAQNRTAGDGEQSRGEAVYTLWCAPCHAPGPGHPGTQALEAKYQGSPPAVLVERPDLNAEFIKFYVRNGITVMPFFRKTEISDADLDALAAYIVEQAHAEN